MNKTTYPLTETEKLIVEIFLSYKEQIKNPEKRKERGLSPKKTIPPYLDVSMPFKNFETVRKKLKALKLSPENWYNYQEKLKAKGIVIMKNRFPGEDARRRPHSKFLFGLEVGIDTFKGLLSTSINDVGFLIKLIRSDYYLALFKNPEFMRHLMDFVVFTKLPEIDKLSQQIKEKAGERTYFSLAHEAAFFETSDPFFMHYYAPLFLDFLQDREMFKAEMGVMRDMYSGIPGGSTLLLDVFLKTLHREDLLSQGFVEFAESTRKHVKESVAQLDIQCRMSYDAAFMGEVKENHKKVASIVNDLKRRDPFYIQHAHDKEEMLQNLQDHSKHKTEAKNRQNKQDLYPPTH